MIKLALSQCIPAFRVVTTEERDLEPKLLWGTVGATGGYTLVKRLKHKHSAGMSTGGFDRCNHYCFIVFSLTRIDT